MRARVATLVAALAACAPVIVPSDQAVPFTTVARGASSHIDTPTTVVIRTTEEWRKFWASHGTLPAPAVDFGKHIVAGVLIGSRPTAGFSVEIVAAQRTADATVIEWVQRGPAAGQMAAQVLTSPFHLVTIPSGTTTVEFKERKQ